MTAAVPGSSEYVPARVRAGGKPSVENCFGCPDEITRVTRTRSPGCGPAPGRERWFIRHRHTRSGRDVEA